jgi:hypothetical protein
MVVGSRMIWVLAWTVGAAAGMAQSAGSAHLPSPAPASEVTVETRFTVPLSYAAVLSRLDAFYDEQIGRKAAIAFPAIAPNVHLDLWHEILAIFEPSQSGLSITLRRATGGVTERFVKGWMLDLAGRLDAPLPLNFTVKPPPADAAAEFEGFRSDLLRVFAAEPNFKSVPAWTHSALLISLAPPAEIVLAPPAAHGTHHLTVSAESAAAAKQLLARILKEGLRPGICAVYSEEAELDREVHLRASEQSAYAGITSSQTVYIPNIDEKRLEERLRTDPEMVKRSAAVSGQFSVRVRAEKGFRKLTVAWSELANYVRGAGTFSAERAIGQSVQTATIRPGSGTPAARPGANAGAHPDGGVSDKQTSSRGSSTSPITTALVRTKLPALAAGAYRVKVDVEDAGGQTRRLDERTYWFDGKTFDEL